MVFANRREAARVLAEKLSPFCKGNKPLVLGIPRGGVVMADIIARFLEGELDVILVRKLRDPYQEEVAIGSIDESGIVDLNRYGVMLNDKEYLEKEVRDQLEVLKERRRQYTPIRPPIDPAGRKVIVVDDGLATGSTMLSALRSIRQGNPSELCVATAVAPSDIVQEVESLADRVICLKEPRLFTAVGQVFRDFGQVEDEEVMRILKEWG